MKKIQKSKIKVKKKQKNWISLIYSNRIHVIEIIVDWQKN